MVEYGGRHLLSRADFPARRPVSGMELRPHGALRRLFTSSWTGASRKRLAGTRLVAAWVQFAVYGTQLSVYDARDGGAGSRGLLMPPQIRPKWDKVTSRLQSESCRQEGYALLSITILVGPDGDPLFWMEPHLR